MSMWRIRHWLFGSHFITIEFGCSDFIRCIHFSIGPHPRPYVKVCGTFRWLDDRQEKWEPLTFDKGPFVKEFCDRKPNLRAVQ